MKSREQQADEWFAVAEQLTDTDPVGAEHAFRKTVELAPRPHYHAYTNLGVLLCEVETRCQEALSVFEIALTLFPDDALLHFNRAVVLEELERYEAAVVAYERCIELDPIHADAHFNVARLSEIRGDKQGVLRHLNAYRRTHRVTTSNWSGRLSAAIAVRSTRSIAAIKLEISTGFIR